MSRLLGASAIAETGSRASAEPLRVSALTGFDPARKSGAYYNEHDQFAAAWLRELIAAGLIAPGEVDERSIEDVLPSDLAGFVQCHFFAGIGVWSLALREAGWPDDGPVWTGSCPCQPFSAAGKGAGFDDERHLWPAFHWLIEQCGPAIVLGEQVASKDGLAWLDLVSADVEASGYAFGAVDTCAAGFGAPHIRQRSYWVAHADDTRLQIGSGPANGRGTLRHERQAASACGLHGGMGNAKLSSQERFRQHGGALVSEQETEGSGLSGEPARWLANANGGNACTERQQRSGEQRQQPQNGGASGVGNAPDQSRERRAGSFLGAKTPFNGERITVDGRVPVGFEYTSPSVGAGPGPLNGLWRAADWLCCTDGKWRPVAPGTFPLAPTGTVRNRVGTLRGAGNAINLAQAQGFIEAVLAIAYTHPKGGDAQQAPLVSGGGAGTAIAQPQTPIARGG